ncbi:MAG: helix-turn-helix domain-containing protein [Planctomycetota bacterium]|jgi:hypothetical protein
MPDDMVSFDEAMKQLQFTEEELQKLVTSGALRAFRSGGEMKFRAGDLDAVKKERETEPTIIIPAAGMDDGADETVVAAGDELQVEMPDDLVVDESAQTVVSGDADQGAPTVTIPEDQGTEELVFDDRELEVLPLEEEAAGTQAAEAATIVEDGGDITVADEMAEADVAEAEVGRPPSSRRRVLSSRVGAAASRRKSAAFEVRKGSPIMAVVLVVSAAAAVFALSVFGSYLIKDYRVGMGSESETSYVPGYLRDMFESTKKWGEPQ